MLKARAFQGIDAGFGVSPVLHDLDNDGDLDLLVGHSLGGIAFYRNTTADPTIPLFTFITNKWGFFEVRDRFGRPNLGDFATPFLADIDNDQELELLVGSQAGDVQIYEGVATALLDTLDFVGNLLDFRFGKYCAPAAAVLDSSGNLTYIVGTGRGGLMLANTLPDDSIAIDLTTDLVDPLAETSGWEATIFPNPTDGQFNIEVKTLKSRIAATIYNSLGEKLGQIENLREGLNPFSLQHLPSGVYFVKLSDGERAETLKVVKK
ncbi:MAG: T9SS type A sorting domain-containing protein [Bacteroidia bacterium]